MERDLVQLDQYLEVDPLQFERKSASVELMKRMLVRQ